MTIFEIYRSNLVGIKERILLNSEPQKSPPEIQDPIEINSPKTIGKKSKSPPPFEPFTVEFADPEPLTVHCTRLINLEADKSLKMYRGIGAKSSELFDVYEWRICLEKNNVYDKKKLEICLSKVGVTVFEKTNSLD